MTSKEREQIIRKVLVKEYTSITGLYLVYALLFTLLDNIIWGILLFLVPTGLFFLFRSGKKYLYDIKKIGENSIEFSYFNFLLKNRFIIIEQEKITKIIIQKRMFLIVGKNDFREEIFDWKMNFELGAVELKEKGNKIISAINS